MKRFCDECGKEVETRIVNKKEKYTIYGDDIFIDTQVLICTQCGQNLYDRELDSNTLTKAYKVYRKKHKLLSPNEIKAIREQYELSQREFSKVLSWGDKTIYRYENGSLQDKAHNSILVLLKDPENMLKYLQDNEISLKDKDKNALLTRTKKLLRRQGRDIATISYSDDFILSVQLSHVMSPSEIALNHFNVYGNFQYESDENIHTNVLYRDVKLNEYIDGDKFNFAA